MKCNAAFNLTPDGAIVLDGDHSPGVSYGEWSDYGISCTRKSDGVYVINGVSINWADGWRSSVYRDDNGRATVFLELGKDGGDLTVKCFDPNDKITPTDIIHLLTLRVCCELEV